MIRTILILSGSITIGGLVFIGTGNVAFGILGFIIGAILLSNLRD